MNKDFETLLLSLVARPERRLFLAIAGPPGSGKSTMMARIINDVLATLPEARVRTVDFGESLAPHVDVTRGRHLRFSLEDTRTINIWDYPGLELGEAPDETQIALVVMDAMRLARVSGFTAVWMRHSTA